MYLAESKWLRLVTLCALYVAQGIPWGFVAVAMKAWLAGDPHRLSPGQLGNLIFYATLPWSFKWIWGFVVDSYQTSLLGKRRPWLILAQLTMIVGLTSIALIVDPVADFDWLLRLVLVANVFVGLQDVSVDAMAVDLLTDEDRERVSGLMYGGSYLGTAIGGAGLGWVIGNYGLQAAIFCQCGLLAAAILLPVFIRERRGDILWPTRSLNVPDVKRSRAFWIAAAHGMKKMGKDLVRAFSLKSTLIGLVVALLVKIGYGIITPSFATYLRNAAGWSVAYYTEVEGLWGSVAGLTACCIGAFAAQRMGAKSVTSLGLLALSGMWITMGIFPELLESDRVTAVVIIGQEAMLAWVTVGLFAIYCAISWPQIGAIQFTAYMALLNLSTSLGSRLAGVADETLELHQIFVLAGLLQALMVIGVLLIDVRETRSRLE